jgi:hypothetical protein
MTGRIWVSASSTTVRDGAAAASPECRRLAVLREPVVPGFVAGGEAAPAAVDPLRVFGAFADLARLLSSAGRTMVSASVSTSGRTEGAEPKRELRTFSAGLAGLAAGLAGLVVLVDELARLAGLLGLAAGVVRLVGVAAGLARLAAGLLGLAAEVAGLVGVNVGIAGLVVLVGGRLGLAAGLVVLAGVAVSLALAAPNAGWNQSRDLEARLSVPRSA